MIHGAKGPAPNPVGGKQIWVANGQEKKRWRVDSSSPQCGQTASEFMFLCFRFSPTGIAFCIAFQINILVFGELLSAQISVFQLKSVPEIVGSQAHLSAAPVLLGFSSRISSS